MTEWQELTLASLGRFSSGKPITPGTVGPYRAFGSNGVIGGSPDSRHDRGIIVGRVGAYCGSVAVSREPFWASDNTIVIEPEADADLDYLYYLLRSANLNRHAGGSAQPLVTQGTLKALPFRVPGPEVRAGIGSVLRNFDDLIENNRRRVEVLEEMARATYGEWFVHFRYPGHETVPLVDSPLAPVPEGWTVHPFSEVADFVNGFAFKPSHWGDAGRPIIKIKELKQGVVADTPRCSPEVVDPKFWVERGDLLFSWSADLGVYLWRDEPGLLNQHLFTVRPKRPGLTVGFLLHALEEAMPQFRSRAQGTTMRHIKRSALSEVKVLLPDDTLTQRFTRDIDPMHDEVARLGQESRSLEAMRDLLLPRLVSGQIDLSTLDLTGLLAGAVA